MLKNYFNTAIRNLTKHKFYSIINILGLSVGLACFLCIALFVTDELSYDRHFQDAEHIYRIDFTGSINGNELVAALMCAPGAQTFKDDYPEVVDAFRFRSTGNWFVKREGTESALKFDDEEVIYADPNFFEFWGVEMIYGDPKTCLNDPKSLVLDESTARKIFGDINPVGEILVLDDELNLKVTGVYEDLPVKSHFGFHILLSMLDHKEADNKMWLSFNFNTYLKFKEGADPNAFLAKMPALVRTKMGAEIEKYLNSNYDEFLENGNTANFYLMPLKDIYLKSQKLGELQKNGDITYVYIFSAIALFILILACINFMNLATARSAGRAKEVGMRKVVGAQGPQLIRQFLSEAILISILSTAIALVLCGLLLPYFNEISGKSLSESDLLAPDFLLMIALISIVVGMLAGSYPAFFLSRFQPVNTLKGKLSLGMNSGGIRSTLVVIQFVVSITMIIGTAIVFDQLQFIQNKNLGFNKEQVIAIRDVWILRDKKETFKQEALRSTYLKSGSLASFVPIGSEGNNSVYWKGEKLNSEETYIINNRRVDYDFVETMQMKIIEGRNFSEDFGTDSLAILVNQSMVKHMGIEEPIGFKISTFRGNAEDDARVATLHIIGVVEDFHYESIKDQIDPILFFLNAEDSHLAVFRFEAEDTKVVIDELNQTWDRLAAGQPFSYYFLDDRFNNYYITEQRTGQIFGVFAFLAVFIACLGLFGLASFTAEQRIKEIAIRKVLGASVSQIVNMLAWNFMKLVAIAFVIAAPIAYFSMRSWLDDFAYRTEIRPVTFLISGLLAAAIAWGTMSFQSWKAARVNPSRSLRNE